MTRQHVIQRKRHVIAILRNERHGVGVGIGLRGLDNARKRDSRNLGIDGRRPARTVRHTCTPHNGGVLVVLGKLAKRCRIACLHVATHRNAPVGRIGNRELVIGTAQRRGSLLEYRADLLDGGHRRLAERKRALDRLLLNNRRRPIHANGLRKRDVVRSTVRCSGAIGLSTRRKRRARRHRHGGYSREHNRSFLGFHCHASYSSTFTNSVTGSFISLPWSSVALILISYVPAFLGVQLTS